MPRGPQQVTELPVATTVERDDAVMIVQDDVSKQAPGDLFVVATGLTCRIHGPITQANYDAIAAAGADEDTLYLIVG